MSDEINNTNEIQWITMNGNHIPIKPGQSKDDAIDQFIANKPKTKQYGIVYYGSKAELVEMDVYNQFTPYRQEGIVNIDEDEINEVINNSIGDLNKYTWDQETDYGSLAAQIRSQLNNIGIDSKISSSKLISNMIVNQFAKIRTHKAEEFLKTMPKLDTKNLSEITEGANLANFLKNTYSEGGHKYTWNCQRCVAAWYLRHLGYNVEAMPFDAERGFFSFPSGSSNAKVDSYGWSFAMFNRNELIQSFEGKNKQWASSQLKELTNIAKNDGPGACYITRVSWRGADSSHVFIVYNDNNEVKFIDPQDNSDASKYFDPAQYTLVTNETKMTRIDKATLNGEVMKHIVKANDSKIDEVLKEKYNHYLKTLEASNKKDYERNMQWQKYLRERRKNRGW